MHKEIDEKMEGIRKRMDSLKGKADKAVLQVEDFHEKNQEANKILHDYLMQIEDNRRHKQSLEHQLKIVKKQLEEKTVYLEKVKLNDEDHTKAVEKVEARGEIHDKRIFEMEPKVKEARKKLNEDQTTLEDGRRRICVLKREIFLAEARNRKHVTKIKDLENIVKSNDRDTNTVDSLKYDMEDKQYELEQEIDKVRAEIKANEERIHAEEGTVQSLNFQVELTKEEITRQKEATQKLKDEMAVLLSELHDFTE